MESSHGSDQRPRTGDKCSKAPRPRPPVTPAKRRKLKKTVRASDGLLSPITPERHLPRTHSTPALPLSPPYTPLNKSELNPRAAPFNAPVPAARKPSPPSPLTPQSPVTKMCRQPSTAIPRVVLLAASPQRPPRPSCPTPRLARAGHPRKPSTHAVPAKRPRSNLGSHYSSRFPAGHLLHRLFVERYRLGAEIGAGGYGFVITAAPRSGLPEVAVKFILKSQIPADAWSFDAHWGGKIPTEIFILRTIRHPAIIACLDIYEDTRYFYLVQELHGSPWQKSACQAVQASPKQELLGAPDQTRAGSAEGVPVESPKLEAARVESPEPLHQSADRERVDTAASGEFEELNANPPLSLPENILRTPNVLRPSVLGRRPSHDLFECIENNQLSKDQARHIFRQVVSAVRHLHTRGIAHRDIKDENILVDKYLRVKLIDFGAAVIENPSNPLKFYSVFHGTPSYAASEVLRHQPFQAPPAEIWTLGILLCNLVYGCSPFPDDSGAVAGNIVLPQRVPNPTWKDDASIDLCLDLVGRCLTPDPQDRATIEEIRTHPWLLRI